ncbi:ATP-binding cassette domain-containing protein [Desulfovibrio psychrotolerans]
MEQKHRESLCPRSPQAAPSSVLPPPFPDSSSASSDRTCRTGHTDRTGHIGRISRTTPAEPLIDIADATVFINRVPVLHNITWSILPGQNWAVCGPNGAGKSTLLRLLLGDTRQAWGGTVRWFGQETPEMHSLRRRIGYVSDRLQATYGHDAYHGTLLDLTGEELVWSGFSASVGLWEWQHITPEQKQAAAAWMHHMGLADHAAQRIRDMSYGRLRRFMLCRAVAPSPDLLVLDEPCSGLDPAARDHFLATLRGLVQSGMQVVYVSHYTSELIPEISHILRLESGHVTFCGPRGHDLPGGSDAGSSATAQGNAHLSVTDISTGTSSGTCSGAESEPAPLLTPGTPFRGLIQIAGIHDMDEATMLIRSGVHALGYPLRLPVNTPDCTEQAAADMARALSGNNGSTTAIPVCICYLNTADAIAAFCRQLHMSRVQLHGPVSPDELERLRHMAPHLFIIKSLVLHPDGGNLPELERTLAQAAPHVDAFITDTRNPATGADGATGMVHNWQASARLVRLSPRPVILAGGLTPDNVAQAIRTVRPAGVDAHTGVEGPDGRKAPRLVQRFVSQAKKAFTEIHASTL